MNPVAEIISQIELLFRTRGAGMYAGEPVTQLEHALQTAHQALSERAPAPLVVAALLHDVGHLLHDHDENCAKDGIDDQHEGEAARWLSQWFPADVVEPVRLHVSAKRYRCATDSEYFMHLSAASKLSLKLQGGPFSRAEIHDFEANPFFESALRLRSWDEQAKEPNAQTPPLSSFLPLVRDVLQSSSES